MTRRDYDVAVVGAGMIGSAACRYLAEAGLHVALVGPSEPPDRTTHSGVWASSYDAGRITRTISGDPVWLALNARSLARYAELEKKSETPFHIPCGYLRIDRPQSDPRSRHAAVHALANAAGIPVETLGDRTLAYRYPWLSVKPGHPGLYEAAPAGCIDPRAMVQAQHRRAIGSGAVRIPELAVSVIRTPEGFAIRMRAGSEVRAAKVLIATGASSGLFPLLPVEPLIQVRPETVALFEVSEDVGEALSGMPSMSYNFDSNGPLPYCYILPPLPYPDGRRYLKIGADHDPDVTLQTHADHIRYFRSEGSAISAERLTDLLHTVIPIARALPRTTSPCLLCYTGHGRPYVDEVESGWFAAIGGNGQGAKASDAIGELAALRILDRPWPDGFRPHDFRFLPFQASQSNT